MNRLLRPIAACIFAAAFTTAAFAQDAWTPSATKGIDEQNNASFRSLHVFNSMLYTGSGSGDSGIVYRSVSGNPGSWSRAYTGDGYSINDIAVTSAGSTNIYIASSRGGFDTSTVYRSASGSAGSWMPFRKSPVEITHLINYKGAGTTDSVYIIESGPTGDYIEKAAANSNDPYNISGSWDTVLDFSVVNPYFMMRCMGVHTTKLYVGSSDASLWMTTDGTHFTRNANVGNGFGDFTNKGITAIASFGGYVYVGTENNSGGAQIWRSNDDVTWTKVQQFSSDFSTVTSLTVANSKLWITVQTVNQYGAVYRSTDGLTYSTSDAFGFGVVGNSAQYASIAAFGNNIYWGGTSYPEFGPQGGQIWRLCTATPPVVSIGPNQTVCPSATTVLNATPGAISYNWSTGETTQSISAVNPGIYSVVYTASSGCSASASMTLSFNSTPNITPPNTMGICSGGTVNMMPMASSDVIIPQTPMHKATHDTINYSLPAVYDTIHVSGLTGTNAGTSIYSVTIDSLNHTFTRDVDISLASPSGSSILLSGGNGGGSDLGYRGTEFNVVATSPISTYDHPPFTGTYAPTDFFNNLSGTPNGDWVLKVVDNYPSDNGALKGWSIRFKTDDTTMTFSWSPAAGLSSTNTLNTTATVATTTMYTLTATNSVGCASSSQIQAYVEHLSLPQAADTVCFGGSVVLSVNGGSANTTWTPTTGLSSSTGSFIFASPTAPITYHLADTINGCPLSDTIHLFINSPITFTPATPVTVCTGDTAVLTSSASGGFAPYSYSWFGGGQSYTGATIHAVPATSATFSISATDAAGCYAGMGSSSITLIPSTDIYGHVGYSGGDVVSSSVVIYRYEPYLNHFDTVMTTTTDASGNYHFAAVNHHDYLMEVFPAAAYATLVPTYYGNVFLWDSATVFSHSCAENDTLNITAAEYSTLGGPGILQGVILQGHGFNTGPGITTHGSNGGVRAPGEPIPGIDVKLGRNPGGQLVTSTVTTDPGGQYTFSNIPLNIGGEHYTVYVDIPGIGRDSSYNVTLTSTDNQFLDLDYYVDSTVVYIVDNTATGIAGVTKAANTFSVYPNPSNGNSTVAYTIANDAKVSLGVYNVLGVKVAELANTEQAAGAYTYVFNAKNYNLKSGIYFVTLITDGKTTIQRLVITE